MITAAKIIDPLIVSLQRSRWRTVILKQLLRLDNWLRRWIAFFSFENNLHVKHRLMRYHDFFTEHVSANDRVLDIGCGNGAVAHDVAQHAQHVTGIDFDRQAIATARQRHSRPNTSFIAGDATTYPFTEKFDVIILSNVLEHIEDRVGLLKRIKNLAPTLLIRVPMINRDWIPLLKRELGIEWRLDPTHTTEYTEPQFRQELAAAELQPIELTVRFGEIYCVAQGSLNHPRP